MIAMLLAVHARTWRIAIALAASACGGGEVDLAKPVSAPVGESPTSVVAPSSDGWWPVTFRADPPVPAGNEAYVCLVLDAPRLAGRYLRSVRWTPPSGPVSLHHATLYSFRGDHGPGAVSCADQPEGTGILHVYTPGAVPLTLPDGVALSLSADTTGLGVEIHALRMADGQAELGTVELQLSDDPPVHVAGWVDDRAPVPTIPPHDELASTGRCRFAEPVHVVSTWPHMHRAGKSFYGAVVRANGAREDFVDVDPWDFSHQRMYPRDVALAAGDGVETLCVWQNTTDLPIFAGALSSDEMCNQGLYVWPIESARCVP